MAADWEFDLPLDAGGRELVVHHLRRLRGSVPSSSSSVGVVVGEFLEQVEGGRERIRLHLGGVDKFGLVHLSNLLASLDTPGGYTRCLRCNGSGDVRMPSPVLGLKSVLDHRYSLDRMTDPERSEHLDWPADKPERDRILAASRLEAARVAAARAQSEERMRVLPGELAEGEPVYEPSQPPAEFIPGRKVAGTFN